ncbi:hypothetical protein NECAME_14053 [Necator americanus]|uniref:Uncharacterized protein n=1 Tax=Necator americanus TaxID=51031 RepID=W2SQZ2_NECAM|nr:hypothetical protein NECAME_14053 [Necator americanus]ETN71923.1 hypothetical protein NECAME_14053 [Necator americanus]
MVESINADPNSLKRSFRHVFLKYSHRFLSFLHYKVFLEIIHQDTNSGYSALGGVAIADPYPYVAFAAPEPLAVLPASIVETAPIVAPAPVVVSDPVVAPAPVVVSEPVVAPAPIFPYTLHSHHHYHHPRTEVHNIVSTYTKETGHVSDTTKADFPTLIGAPLQQKLLDAKKSAKTLEKTKS